MADIRLSRRRFLVTAGMAGAWGLVPRARGKAWWLAREVDILQGPAADPWASVPEILKRIHPPTFPARDVVVTAYGAVGDGEKDCTTAIRAAIAACHANGGGRVVVPPGRFLTGAIHLASGVNLHLERGATLAFSRDPRQYLPVVFTRWEGVELMNYSPFIYAFEARDIAVTGEGTLDGQADEAHWWDWRASSSGAVGVRQTADRTRLMEMGQQGVPVAERVFGEGHYLRPNFIQPYRCQNVLIEGVTVLNSPMWEVHPVLCRNVTVRGLTINTHGPNNDGCDPESCCDVLIEQCTFDTGDDCIALKSGRNNDGRRLNTPVENVIVRDCIMKDGHGGVVIGSEISGGARNVFAERCRMDSPHLDRALRIKTNSVRGGVVEHVYMRDCTIGQVAEAVVTINFFYEEGDAGQFPPVVRDIELQRVTSKKSQYALLLRGYPHAPIRDIRVMDCSFDGVERPDVLESVEGLRFTNVTVNGKPRQQTPDDAEHDPNPSRLSSRDRAGLLAGTGRRHLDRPPAVARVPQWVQAQQGQAAGTGAGGQ